MLLSAEQHTQTEGGKWCSWVAKFRRAEAARAYRLLGAAEPVPGEEGGVEGEDVIADLFVSPGLHQLNVLPHHLGSHLWVLNQDSATHHPQLSYCRKDVTSCFLIWSCIESLAS